MKSHQELLAVEVAAYKPSNITDAIGPDPYGLRHYQAIAQNYTLKDLLPPAAIEKIYQHKGWHEKNPVPKVFHVIWCGSVFPTFEISYKVGQLIYQQVSKVKANSDYVHLLWVDRDVSSKQDWYRENHIIPIQIDDVFPYTNDPIECTLYTYYLNEKNRKSWGAG